MPSTAPAPGTRSAARSPQALAEGADLVEAARWAVRVAAVSVTRMGAQGGLPRREDVPGG